MWSGIQEGRVPKLFGCGTLVIKFPIPLDTLFARLRQRLGARILVRRGLICPAYYSVDIQPSRILLWGPMSGRGSNSCLVRCDPQQSPQGTTLVCRGYCVAMIILFAIWGGGAAAGGIWMCLDLFAGHLTPNGPLLFALLLPVGMVLSILSWRGYRADFRAIANILATVPLDGFSEEGQDRMALKSV